MIAEGLPEDDGMPMAGADLECRQHFCEQAADDESLCSNAMGEAVCI